MSEQDKPKLGPYKMTKGETIPNVPVAIGLSDHMEAPPSYCRECGAALVRFAVPDGYDPHTGRLIERFELRCSRRPRQGFWNSAHRVYRLHTRQDGTEGVGILSGGAW